MKFNDPLLIIFAASFQIVHQLRRADIENTFSVSPDHEK